MRLGNTVAIYLMTAVGVSAVAIFAVVEEDVVLECSSNSEVMWEVQLFGSDESSEIALGADVITPFIGRFKVSNNHSLEFHSVTLRDAGGYWCTDEIGLGKIVHMYNLSVIASEVSCKSDIDETKPFISCGSQKQFSIGYECQVIYNGLTQPKITWTELPNGNIMDNFKLAVQKDRLRSTQNLSSILSVNATIEMPSYECSVENLFTCTTIPIPIKYAIESDHHAIEPKECKAKSNAPCFYVWTSGNDIISFNSEAELSFFTNIFKLEPNITCSAICNLDSQVCIVKVMTRSRPHFYEYLTIYGGHIMVIFVLLILSFFVLQIIWNKWMCPESWMKKILFDKNTSTKSFHDMKNIHLLNSYCKNGNKNGESTEQQQKSGSKHKRGKRWFN